MSGETESNVSAWTIDSLHTHMLKILEERDVRYNQRYEGQQEAVNAALAAAKEAVTAALIAADRAVSKAELAAEKRFEGVNEFRGQLSDQARTFMPRSEAAVEIANLREKIEAQNNLIAALTARLDRGEGKSTGFKEGWGYLIGAVGLILTIITIVSVFYAFTKGG